MPASCLGYWYPVVVVQLHERCDALADSFVPEAGFCRLRQNSLQQRWEWEEEARRRDLGSSLEQECFLSQHVFAAQGYLHEGMLSTLLLAGRPPAEHPFEG